MLSFLRGAGPTRRATYNDNPVYYEGGTSWQEFHSASSRYFTTHAISNTKSLMNPPQHLHLFQSEYFRVRSGTGVWTLPTTTEPSKRQQVKVADEEIYLPKGIYHVFQNSSDSEQLVVDIRIEPESAPRGVEEMFFRNLFGYLDDCRAQKVEPSVFQLQLFMWSVGVCLAIPVPGPDRMKWVVSAAVCWIMGVLIGEGLLGYRRTYVEYYRS